MKRTWITTFTLATVIGSGGALAGVLAAGNESPTIARAQSLPVEAALIEPTTPALQAAGSVAYQVGAAGTVTLSVADSTLTVARAAAGTGWITVTSSAPGTHIEVQFTDTTQLVTFAADLVGSNVVVQVTNVPVATTPPSTAATNPSPATTASQTAQQPNSQPTAPTQAPPATAAPTRSDDGSYGDGDDHESEEHESEPGDD